MDGIFARGTDGHYYCLSTGDYRDLYPTYDSLYQIKDRLFIKKIVTQLGRTLDKFVGIEYLAIRSLDDPDERWQGALPTNNIFKVVEGTSPNGYKNEGYAYKKAVLVKDPTVVSHGGGWLRRGTSSRPFTQGWWGAFIAICGNWNVRLIEGRYTVLEPVWRGLSFQLGG